MDNIAQEVEVVAERSNSKSLYQLNKVPASQFTLSGKAVNKKQIKTLTEIERTRSVTFQGLTQLASHNTSKKLHSPN